MTPFSFQFPLADFDLTRLPVDPELLRGDASMLAAAVQEFYRESFEKLGGSATVVVRDGVVSVAWQPGSGDASAQLLQHAIGLLRQGNTSGAEPILRALLAQDARNADALYNLGMMLSDQGRLAEAVETLQELLNFHPARSEGWTALGVAHARLNAIPEAVKALERAIEIDPRNAHALRNLAAIHGKESPARALPLMQEAARLLPGDQRSQYGLPIELLPPEEREFFINCIPVFPSLKIAAGQWGPDCAGFEQSLEQAEDWIPLPKGVRPEQRAFVAFVIGKSMEPIVPDGSWCVFGPAPEGSREGKNLLVWHESFEDPEGLGHYTLKRWHSEKTVEPDDTGQSWRHVAVVLEPLNKSFEPILLNPDDAGMVRVVAELLRVLPSKIQ